MIAWAFVVVNGAGWAVTLGLASYWRLRAKRAQLDVAALSVNLDATERALGDVRRELRESPQMFPGKAQKYAPQRGLGPAPASVPRRSDWASIGRRV